MGIFDLFKSVKSSIQVMDDVIWMTPEAKAAGIKAAIQQSFAERDGPVAILLVAHFEDCFHELRQLAETQAGGNRIIMAVTVASLKAASSPVTAFNESHFIKLIVGERHPLASQDEDIIEFARRLPCRCRVVHHLSLKDPLMQVFCGDWIESVLKRLGMKDDEAIESRMVSRRIRNSQKKIGQRSIGDEPAESAEQWLEHNCPNFSL